MVALCSSVVLPMCYIHQIARRISFEMTPQISHNIQLCVSLADTTPINREDSFESLSASKQSIRNRFRLLNISEDDLEEQFVRGGGKGGQKINKTNSCVVLRHNASSSVVRCQYSRFQSSNRVRARELLADRLEKKLRLQQAQSESLLQKELRRNRTPTEKQKQDIRQLKVRRSETKRKRSSAMGEVSKLL